MRREIKGDLCHELLTKKIKQKLAFNEKCDAAVWKKQVKEKLVELLGLEKISLNACELNLLIEEDIDKGDYRQIRFTFESEVGAFVPCYLLLPKTDKKKYPVAITLQGHSTGFHNSIGEPKSADDEEYVKRGDFGVQAVKNGFAALCIEQRAMGERCTTRHTFGAKMCDFQSLTGMLLGRTVLGERIWDVQKTIDLLTEFDMLDTEKILITGNSGGGTMSFYAACIDERIKISAPSCAFCSYSASILNVYHCSCNYIPNAYEWFEMQDLACLIAPRKFIVIAGVEDRIFPIDGVKTAYETVKSIYKKFNAKDNCSLTITDKGHYWCKDVVWDKITSVTKSLNW